MTHSKQKSSYLVLKTQAFTLPRTLNPSVVQEGVGDLTF